MQQSGGTAGLIVPVERPYIVESMEVRTALGLDTSCASCDDAAEADGHSSQEQEGVQAPEQRCERGPTHKRNNQNDTRSQSQAAILVIGGSFCPPHAGHLAALDGARKRAEKKGLRVVAGYLACAHDGHVRGKLKGRGESKFVFGAEARLRMCNAVAEASDWLQPTPQTFGSAQQCGKAMVEAHHGPKTRVLVVKGRDAPLLTTGEARARASARRETVSSTLVRREMREGGAGALDRLVAEGLLPTCVADELRRALVTAAEGA